MQTATATTTGLRLDALRGANAARLPTFRNKHGALAHSKADGSDWSPAQWLQAVTGELGEYANIRKKFERGDLTAEEFQIAAAKELADVQTYLDLLAMQVGVDLGQATIDKFNEVSERVKSPVRLDADGWHQVLEIPDLEAAPRCWPPRMEKVLGSDGQHLATLLPDYGLMFDATGPRQATSHANARTLASELQLLGFKDWRLPESHELALLIRHDKYKPAIDTEFFPITPTDDWYWSNTEHASGSSYAWGVGFDNGLVDIGHRGNGGFVRAVRRVPASQS